MSLCTLWKRIVLICVCGWHKIGWKETQDWSDVEKYSIKKSICENQHLSLVMKTWDVNTMWNKHRCCGKLLSRVWVVKWRKMFRIMRIFVSLHGLWHGGLCPTKEFTPCIDDLRTLKKKDWNLLGELSQVCSLKGSEMIIFDTSWMIWYPMISEWTYTIDLKMDQSLCQTPESIDIFHSSRMWIETILHCGWHRIIMQTGTVSRFWLSREILRIQNSLLEEDYASLEVIHLFQ